MTKNSESVDLDSIIKELGSFGRYQRRNYCLILLPILFSAVYGSQYIFAASAVPYRCLVPECESSPPSFTAGPWAEWTFPPGEDVRCRRLAPLPPVTGDTTPACSPLAFLTNHTEPCTGWIYQHDYSIVSEFELACQEWRRTLVGTIHSVGLFAALPLTGYVSDMFGRRTAFILTAVLAGVMGLVRSFSVSYQMYLTFEFLEAMLGSGVYSTGFILALEIVSIERRVVGGNMISCAFALGQVVLALAAWAVPHWRTLLRLLYAPSLLFGFYYFFIGESVRWLLSKGRKEEAAKIIFRVAEINNKKLPPEVIKQLTTEDKPAEDNKPNETFKVKDLPPSESIVKERSLAGQVIRSKIIMARLCICSFWWMTVTFVYYGLSINSVSLAGNSYVNYILSSLVEIPGYALSVLTLDRFGRKISIITAFFVCAISLLVFPFVPLSLSWLATSLTMVGKLSISMTFSSIYIYTSELFPTTARHSLLAFCSMLGRVGSIVAPQTPLLTRYMYSLPYLLFGGLALTSALLMLLTPETLRVRLPDTIAQAESIHSGVKPSASAVDTEH